MVDISYSGSFELALGETTAELKRLNRRMAAYLRAYEQPIDLPVATSAVCPASGQFAMSLGGPSMGRKWLVRQLCVGGGAFPWDADGTAYVFSGVNPLATGVPGPGVGLDDFTSNTFPQVAWYSNRQLVVVGGSQLWILINDGTESTQYFASGQVEDWTDKPYTAVEVD